MSMLPNGQFAAAAAAGEGGADDDLSWILTCPEAAASAWSAAGLLMPPLPRELADSLEQFGAMAFGTHDLDPADRADWIARAGDAASPNALAMNHTGHGFNSHALSYQLVLPALAIFFRQSFGGIHDQPPGEARRFNATVERLEELIVLADAASAAGRIPPGHRLVVAIDDREDSGWQLAPGGAWHDTGRPIDEALRSLAAAAH